MKLRLPIGSGSGCRVADLEDRAGLDPTFGLKSLKPWSRDSAMERRVTGRGWAFI